MALPALHTTRARIFMWYLRLRHASARTERFQPILRAEFAQGDRYAEARFLHRAGFYAAAIAVERNAIENGLRKVALLTEDWRSVRRFGIDRLKMFLRREGVLTKCQADTIDRFSGRANKAVHSATFFRNQSERALSDGEKVRAVIDEARRLVLRRLNSAERGAA